jgi:hypothetical protein
VFGRADNVLTVCEMKYSRNAVGVEAIAEMERKIELLRPLPKARRFCRCSLFATNLRRRWWTEPTSTALWMRGTSCSRIA